MAGRNRREAATSVVERDKELFSHCGRRKLRAQLGKVGVEFGQTMKVALLASASSKLSVGEHSSSKAERLRALAGTSTWTLQRCASRCRWKSRAGRAGEPGSFLTYHGATDPASCGGGPLVLGQPDWRGNLRAEPRIHARRADQIPDL